MSASPPSLLRMGLLIAITVLLAAMTLGFVVAGLVAWRVVPEAMGILRDLRQELTLTRQTTQDLNAELERMKAIADQTSIQTAQRQTEMQTALRARSRKTQEQWRGIEKRRAQIPESVSANPLAKIDALIALTQILADEILVLGRHLAETQTGLAEALEPLPVQDKSKSR